MTGARTDDSLPREIAPGLWWIGVCMGLPYQDTELHTYNSAYLVAGRAAALLIETGHPRDAEATLTQVQRALERTGVPLRYIFTTHQETPHAGGLGYLLKHFPDAVVCGDVRDYHLVFPQHARRLRPLAAGDELDLGGTRIRVLHPVLKDLTSTLWAFDPLRRALFPGDGFAYSHYHGQRQCGRLAEEVPDLPFAEMAGLFAEAALYWTRFVAIEPYIARLDALLDELDVRLIAPTHGLPIGDVPAIVPAIRRGLRAVSPNVVRGTTSV